MNKKYITWQEIFDRITSLNLQEEIVYGVPKGGMVLMAFMKEQAFTHLPEKATVIIDDLIDSGRTREHYKKKFPNTKFIGLFDKLTEPGIQNIWLVFPWEKDHPGENEDNIQDNVVRILQYLGEDCTREGLLETPKRVVKMWGEIFRGYDSKQRPKVSIFKNGSDGLVYDQMIIDTGDFYSHCEHHMVPFFGKYWFGYIPDANGAIIGLSKVARLVDYHAAKLQIQERLVNDIVEDIWKALSEDGAVRPIGMGLMMEGEHLCKTMRGVKKKGTMTTIKLKGAFLDNPAVKSEFLNRCI